jgi:hypothetical protein
MAYSSELDSIFVFGGRLYYLDGSVRFLNDIWVFNHSSSIWKCWFNCAGNNLNRLGIYSGNDISPGSRRAQIAVSNGGFVVFGGFGYDSNGYGMLNDLWEFKWSTGKWRWLAGNSVLNGLVSFSQSQLRGVFTAVNGYPGSRYGNVLAVDLSAEKVYLHGGVGFSVESNSVRYGYTNDLWSFDMKNNVWEFITGYTTTMSTRTGIDGNYSLTGVEDSFLQPRRRSYHSASFDQKKKILYVFGGLGIGSEGIADLWRFNFATRKWAYLRGSYQAGSSETISSSNGVFDSSNYQSNRFIALHTSDNDGNLYLMGGIQDQGGNLNELFPQDLWVYNSTLSAWSRLYNSEQNEYATYDGSCSEIRPGSRLQGGLAVRKGKIFLHGGYKDSIIWNYVDLWSFSFANSSDCNSTQVIVPTTPVTRSPSSAPPSQISNSPGPSTGPPSPSSTITRTPTFARTFRPTISDGTVDTESDNPSASSSPSIGAVASRIVLGVVSASIGLLLVLKAIKIRKQRLLRQDN